MNITWLTNRLTELGLPIAASYPAAVTLLFILVFTVAAIANLIVRRTLLRFVLQWIQNNKFQWDEPLLKNKFFLRISWFVPMSIFAIALDTILKHDSALYLLVHRIVMSGFVIISVLSLSALLSSINEIHHLLRKTRRSVLQGYTDAGKIAIYVLGVILIISIFTGKSPLGILSVLGGLTAVTMLVFKDSILGFVASLQLSSTDMVRIGDWIEMPNYGADGDVISMSIHSVRVQNWDKTISTIPTYALVSSSFKNWRGMSESGGRRIKRALNIDLHSIRFCSDEMVAGFLHIEILRKYLSQKEKEITEYNTHSPIDTSLVLNGRRQTNVGIFRAYIISYLKRNKSIHKGMTFLVRQLPPTDHGLPLEIYVFSKDQAWANYEAIQADIFDHLLAAAPEFGLRIFQIPSGYDLRSITGYNKNPQ
jgi:miniconductance mechanosensitive channel